MIFTDKDKKALQVGIFIAILLGAGIGYYHVTILKPKIKANSSKVEELKSEVRQLNQDYREMMALVDQEETIRAMEKAVLDAARRLPSRPDAPGFLNELIEILRITGVKNQTITPQPYEEHTLYTAIPYDIECSSRYHEFGQYLNLIEENPDRFMRVNNFHIANDDKRPSIHPVSLRISTFMFNAQ
jgi:Tfp pilus assembly protein PilO